MHVELVRVTTADGVRLDGMLADPRCGRALGMTGAAERPSGGEPAEREAADASGMGVDAFLLLHGTGGNFYGSTLLEQLAGRLVELGAAVATVNTRGHDVVSMAATESGPRRLGAAYERVDDCRQDLAAWVDLLARRGYRRLGVAGHSLGAVKATYALAQGQTGVERLIALSPPRLSHARFLASIKGAEFRQTWEAALAHVEEGRGEVLLDVGFPLPYLVTAAGYVDKYGPEERYDVVKHLPRVACPTLVTLGSVETQQNVAFQGLPEAIETLRRSKEDLQLAVVAGADHVYSGCRSELIGQIERWLRRLARSGERGGV